MKNFVSYEIAKKLKEKGFDEGCYKYYENKTLKWANFPWLETKYNSFSPHTIAAPTIEQVMKWLRHNEVFIDVRFNRFYKRFKVYAYGISENSYDMHEDHFFNTYEDAAIAGIEYSLNNLI